MSADPTLHDLHNAKLMLDFVQQRLREKTEHTLSHAHDLRTAVIADLEAQQKDDVELSPIRSIKTPTPDQLVAVISGQSNSVDFVVELEYGTHTLSVPVADGKLEHAHLQAATAVHDFCVAHHVHHQRAPQGGDEVNDFEVLLTTFVQDFLVGTSSAAAQYDEDTPAS